MNSFPEDVGVLRGEKEVGKEYEDDPGLCLETNGPGRGGGGSGGGRAEEQIGQRRDRGGWEAESSQRRPRDGRLAGEMLPWKAQVIPEDKSCQKGSKSGVGE